MRFLVLLLLVVLVTMSLLTFSVVSSSTLTSRIFFSDEPLEQDHHSHYPFGNSFNSPRQPQQQQQHRRFSSPPVHSTRACRGLRDLEAQDRCIRAVLHSPSSTNFASFPSASNTNTSVVNVYDFGAVGDGAHDDTSAFQSALNSQGNAGGGIVFVPRGLFRFAGTIVVPKSVTLAGTFQAVPSHAGIRDPGSLKPTDGSILMPTADRGNENGTPFITLQEDSTLRGVVIYYPDQATNTLPNVYPWAISMSGNNPAVMDVELLNPYLGISAVAAHRHYIARVQGQPFKIGIFVDQTYDVA